VGNLTTFVDCERDDVCGIVEWDNNSESLNGIVTGASGRGLLYVIIRKVHIKAYKHTVL
jgi:hypothetical protein